MWADFSQFFYHCYFWLEGKFFYISISPKMLQINQRIFPEKVTSFICNTLILSRFYKKASLNNFIKKQAEMISNRNVSILVILEIQFILSFQVGCYFFSLILKQAFQNPPIYHLLTKKTSFFHKKMQKEKILIILFLGLDQVQKH